MVGKRVVSHSGEESTNLRKDIEQGRPEPNRRYRFRDQENLDPDDQRRVDFKRKLLDALEGSDLEGFRKSDDEVPPPPLWSARDGEARGGCMLMTVAAWFKSIRDKKSPALL